MFKKNFRERSLTIIKARRAIEYGTRHEEKKKKTIITANASATLPCVQYIFIVITFCALLRRADTTRDVLFILRRYTSYTVHTRVLKCNCIVGFRRRVSREFAVRFAERNHDTERGKENVFTRPYSMGNNAHCCAYKAPTVHSDDAFFISTKSNRIVPVTGDRDRPPFFDRRYF